MLSLRKSSLLLVALLIAACQKVDLTADPEDKPDTPAANPEVQAASLLGTGEGTPSMPYTVNDVRSGVPSATGDVWVIGYMVGTAPRSMSAASFAAEATNRSNILLSGDALCTDTACCIPVELSSEKMRKLLALPDNRAHYRQCVLLCGTPSVYLYRKGLRSITAAQWLDGFDISTIAPEDWEVVPLD